VLANRDLRAGDGAPFVGTLWRRWPNIGVRGCKLPASVDSSILTTTQGAECAHYKIRCKLNGVTVGPTSSSFSSLTPFSLTSGFVAGINTLDFILTNGPTGGPQNPTGLFVELSGYAKRPSNPPGQYSSSIAVPMCRHPARQQPTSAVARRRACPPWSRRSPRALRWATLVGAPRRLPAGRECRRASVSRVAANASRIPPFDRLCEAELERIARGTGRNASRRYAILCASVLRRRKTAGRPPDAPRPFSSCAPAACRVLYNGWRRQGLLRPHSCITVTDYFVPR
jgi:hypothetical protein